MKKYTKLHLFMIIPMVVMQLGIAYDYWGDFADNTWAVHIHYWTGSFWYFFLIIQPYYATHGQMEKHRTNGIIGMFLAGGVGFGALSMMYRDIRLVQLSIDFPERFGPFKAWFFYGIPVVEIVMITAFMFAVVQSIIHRKDLENHAWWLISTVFIIMMPALSRGIQFVQIMMYGFVEDLDTTVAIHISNIATIVLIVLAAIKYDKLKHRATFLAISVNIFNSFLEPIGKSEVVQEFLKAVIKG